MVQMIHNKKSLESIFVDYQYGNGNCDVQQMVYEQGFQYGYFHGPERPIHAPLLENILDLTQTKVAKLGKIRKFRFINEFYEIIYLFSIFSTIPRLSKCRCVRSLCRSQANVDSNSFNIPS